MSQTAPLGPGGRPFRGLRGVAVLLGLAAFGANLVILLADRAPGVFSRISLRIDASVDRAASVTGIGVPGRDVRVPQSDFGVHVTIWAVAALLVGLAMWSWLSLAVGGGLVFASSVVIELSQSIFTQSRHVQLSDVAGNATGVVLGTVIVTAFASVWRLSHPRPVWP